MRRKTIDTNDFNSIKDYECESHPIEKNIDFGCFNPRNWDIMMRTYMKKRPTP